MYCWYTRNTYLENNIKVPERRLSAGCRWICRRSTCRSISLPPARITLCPGNRHFDRRICVGGEARFVARCERTRRGGHQSSGSEQTLPLAQRRSGIRPAGLVRRRRGETWKLVVRLEYVVEALLRGGYSGASQPGNARYKPIEAAPGRYVKAKSNSPIARIVFLRLPQRWSMRPNIWRDFTGILGRVPQDR